MPEAPLHTPQGTYQLNFAALIRLRWVAIIGQSLAIMTALFFMQLSLPWLGLGVVVVLEVISNMGLLWVSRREGGINSESVLGAVLAMDVLFLTALLAMSGAATNPFTVIYMIHITLASVTVGERWSWGLVALSLGTHGALFLVGDAPTLVRSPTGKQEMILLEWHLEGVWLAMALTSTLIVAFVHRIRRQLAARNLQVAQLAELRSKQERLAGLVTLSAGAAHELSTPLSTIALVARELERAIARHSPQHTDMVEDAQLIRGQVDRCQRILQSMAADAGESMGELPRGVRVEELFEEVLEEMMRPDGVKLVASQEALTAHALVSPRAMSLAMQGVIRNAREAALERGLPVDVELDALLTPKQVTLQIRDRSGGMSEEVMRRAQDPFFSTKPPGRGMGIGLFLASTLCERLGGTLELSTTAGAGTTASMQLVRTHPKQPEQERT